VDFSWIVEISLELLLGFSSRIRADSMVARLWRSNY